MQSFLDSCWYSSFNPLYTQSCREPGSFYVEVFSQCCFLWGLSTLFFHPISHVKWTFTNFLWPICLSVKLSIPTLSFLIMSMHDPSEFHSECDFSCRCCILTCASHSHFMIPYFYTMQWEFIIWRQVISAAPESGK